jgi:demethylmenaquinone methyltransferase/2-methoxy-6-polyprenyl-1,4-benzoquinol methylase
VGAAKLGESAAHYRDLAPRYDHHTRRINAVREKAIDALVLRPGETVLDAGCGTGWCFPRLAQAVGSGGRIVAFDPSPEMLEVARRRLPAGGAKLDVLIATGEAARLPAAPDAILFSYTHDLIRSRAALGNLFSQARIGARVAATSTKLYAPWIFPANWYLRYSHRGYITNFEGFETPWSLLAELLDDFRVDTHGLTQHYVATGRVRG